jgi:hypothetical protein
MARFHWLVVGGRFMEMMWADKLVALRGWKLEFGCNCLYCPSIVILPYDRYSEVIITSYVSHVLYVVRLSELVCKSRQISVYFDFSNSLIDVNLVLSY